MESTITPEQKKPFDDSKKRPVFSLKDSENFFDLLQEKLSISVENVLFRGESLSTLFINAIDRKNINKHGYQLYDREKSPELIYAGLHAQRELLRRNIMRWGKGEIAESLLNNE